MFVCSLLVSLLFGVELGSCIMKTLGHTWYTFNNLYLLVLCTCIVHLLRSYKNLFVLSIALSASFDVLWAHTYVICCSGLIRRRPANFIMPRMLRSCMEGFKARMKLKRQQTIAKETSKMIKVQKLKELGFNRIEATEALQAFKYDLSLAIDLLTDF